jgi:geranylgeranyl pyrophosphate synthase|tara:strand:- start:1689 stop:2645 length:957 start_codon:yes stop_codon:yes gene_type:complete
MNKFEDFKSIFIKEFLKIQDIEGPSYLYDPIKYFINSPGKRLRPIIVLFLGDLFNNKIKDSKNGALGVELLHNFTLVHDDIMDEDDLRHNVTTIHKKWDNAHAVLSGDGLGALGPLFIGKIQKNTLKILIRYNEVILEICEGQAYDMEFENSKNITVNEYLKMSQKKTGSLFELCFEIPSLISEKYDNSVDKFKSLGRNLGVIFQIQDDILELTLDDSQMGKGTLSDIARDKKTILNCLAFEKDSKSWNAFRESISSLRGIKKKDAIAEYFEKNDIKTEAINLLDKYVLKCDEIVMNLPKEIQNDLKELIDYIINREK